MLKAEIKYMCKGFQRCMKVDKKAEQVTWEK